MSKTWLYLLGGALGVTAFYYLCKGVYWLVTSDRVQARVSQVSWDHRTHLRERKIYSDSGWGDPPSEQGYYDDPTFDWDCYMRRRGSTCIAHDKHGNCTASVPSHDRWCDYRYFDWPIIETKVASGLGHEMFWATFGKRLDDLHRETHQERYEVSFVNPDGRSWKYTTTNEAQFRTFEVGDYWNLKLPHVGSMEPVGKVNLESPQ